MKFCKDCKFKHVPDGVIRCSAPQAENFREPVTGTRPTCQDMRKEGHRYDSLRNWDEACGTEARWYEERLHEGT